MPNFLQSAIDAANLLIDRQSIRVAESPDGELCITIPKGYEPKWCSVAIYGPDNIQLFPINEQVMEARPTCMDFDSWNWLDRLSASTGDAKYSTLVDGMAAAFRDYGFDVRSGLAYWGNEALFDVKSLGVAPTRVEYMPKFKPAALPLERAWRAAPEKMRRMTRSSFQGLVTRPATMDYNRFCFYGFDDRRNKPSLEFNAHHCAFAQSAAWMIHWWLMGYKKTGDVEMLAWARTMTKKWCDVQDPTTGLIPHWFGTDKPGNVQPPQKVANAGDAITAIEWIRCAAVIRGDPHDAGLSDQLSNLGTSLMRSMARYDYDEKRRVFPQWLVAATGQIDESMIYYAFRSAEQKAHWVKVKPALEQVAVYGGDEHFSTGPWTYGTGPHMPAPLGEAAALTRDPYLIERAGLIADHAMEADAGLNGTHNSKGQWLFPAAAAYIKLLLSLHTSTGESRRLKQAISLGEKHQRALDANTTANPTWWQTPFRAAWMEALLALHEKTR